MDIIKGSELRSDNNSVDLQMFLHFYYQCCDFDWHQYEEKSKPHYDMQQCIKLKMLDHEGSDHLYSFYLVISLAMSTSCTEQCPSFSPTSSYSTS